MGFASMVETQEIFFQTPVNDTSRFTDVSSWSANITNTSLDIKMDEAQDQIDAGNLQDAEDTLEDVINDISLTQKRVGATPDSYRSGGINKYKISNGIMYTNFREGYVEMTYLALPVDEFGMPMVPDDERFIQAVKWYLISRLDYKRWRMSRNAMDERIFASSERESLWYIQSARGRHKVPSIDMMEGIKNMLLRSIVKINEHKTGFKNTNITEQRNF